MRARTWLAGLMLVAGCGRQLNPDYCAAHQDDPDCALEGYKSIDAAPPCMQNSDCTKDPAKHVCDTAIGACVECADNASCPIEKHVCTTGDVCVECVLDTDCASQLCLAASGVCADASTILHASPAGVTSGDCTTTACTLDYAVTQANPTHHIIELAGGTYHLNATLELGLEGLHLVPEHGQGTPVLTTGSGTVLHVTKSVELDGVELSGTNDDIVVCDGPSGKANLVLEQVSVHGTSRDGINAKNCNVTIERSKLFSCQETAVWVDDGTVNLRNNFIFSNGQNTYQYAAVVFRGSTTGNLVFNTFGYNTGYDQTFGMGSHQTRIQYPAGLDCDQDNGSTVTATGNLFSENQPLAVRYTRCSGDYTSDNLIAPNTDAQFKAPPQDLHLTTATATGPNKVRDDGNSDCSGDGVDFDGDARPQNAACDYGADELASSIP